jgi:PIN like domain/Restriction endonuclease
MTQAQREPKGRSYRLTVEFDGWLRDRPLTLKEFLENGLVVLDANVLLDLYEVGAQARNEILDTLRSIRNRLWIPNQVALEFSRRRRQVVLDRMSSYKRVKTDVRTAAASAADVIEAAVDRVRTLRERSRTSRFWDLAAARLDRESIEARLSGIMDAALAELQALEAEQDLTVKDIQDGDPILAEIDNLLLGRIGKPYSSDQLRIIVDDAVSFRYPNLIPPGYSDADKVTSLRAAGDYILWRQIIDKASRPSSMNRRILLVTDDVKEDWWTLNSKGRPTGARPELALELFQNTEASLALLTLADFLESAKEHLSSKISDATVDQIRTTTSHLDVLVNELRESPDQPNLLDLTPIEFESLVFRLLTAMGYSFTDDEKTADGGRRLSLMQTDMAIGSMNIYVEIKRYRAPVQSSTVREVLGSMQILHANKAFIITTSSFTTDARRLAEDASIELIDGLELLELLSQHMNVHARIGDTRIGDSHIDDT